MTIARATEIKPTETKPVGREVKIEEHDDMSYWGYTGPDGSQVSGTIVVSDTPTDTRYHMIKVPSLGIIETRQYVGNKIYRTIIDTADGTALEIED